MQGVCDVYNWNEAECRHRDPHYIISLRAEGSASVGKEGDKCILAVLQRQRRVTVWFRHQSPNGFSKAKRDQHSGERFVSVSAILVHLSAVHHGRNRQTWHTGHIWFPYWRRDGERMAAVWGSIAALCHVQKYLHQWCWLWGTRWRCLDSLTTSSSLPDGSYWCD